MTPKIGGSLERTALKNANVLARNDKHAGVGHGILKIAKTVGVGSGTVQQLTREIAA
jgi:hypothetical protein